MKKAVNTIPIVGIWYHVIDGPYKGFIGICVSVHLDRDLPVILNDLNFNGKAVKAEEIKKTVAQPSDFKSPVTNKLS